MARLAKELLKSAAGPESAALCAERAGDELGDAGGLPRWARRSLDAPAAHRLWAHGRSSVNKALGAVSFCEDVAFLDEVAGRERRARVHAALISHPRWPLAQATALACRLPSDTAWAALQTRLALDRIDDESLDALLAVEIKSQALQAALIVVAGDPTTTTPCLSRLIGWSREVDDVIARRPDLCATGLATKLCRPDAPYWYAQTPEGRLIHGRSPERYLVAMRLAERSDLSELGPSVLAFLLEVPASGPRQELSKRSDLPKVIYGQLARSADTHSFLASNPACPESVLLSLPAGERTIAALGRLVAARFGDRAAAYEAALELVGAGAVTLSIAELLDTIEELVAS